MIRLKGISTVSYKDYFKGARQRNTSAATCFKAVVNLLLRLVPCGWKTSRAAGFYSQYCAVLHNSYTSSHHNDTKQQSYPTFLILVKYMCYQHHILFIPTLRQVNGFVTFPSVTPLQIVVLRSRSTSVLPSTDSEDNFYWYQ